MITYDVEIKATVRKFIRVEAANEEEASEVAHEFFSVLEDGTEEEYKEEILSIKEVPSETNS